MGLGGFGGGVGAARSRVGVLGGVLGGLEGMHITLGPWAGGRVGEGWLVFLRLFFGNRGSGRKMLPNSLS